MLADFCRNIKCDVRQVLDNPKIQELKNEKNENLFKGSTCKHCMAWKYERFLEEHGGTESCVTRG